MTEQRAEAVIVGGGLAGLACAISAGSAASPTACILLEKERSRGRKLLVSGDGQCNITNWQPIDHFFDHYGPPAKSRFVRSILLEYPNTSLMSFLSKRGLALEREPGGKVFPQSRKSRDIFNLFEEEAKRYCLSRPTLSGVRHIEKAARGFSVYTEASCIETKRLVLATGGASWPKLGSDGSGFTLARSLGHSIIDPRPALAAVYASPWPLADCSGIAFDSPRIAVFREGRVIHRTSGPVLITHRGLSGPAILNLSRYLYPGDRLDVSLVSACDANTLSRELLQWCQARPGTAIKTFFHQRNLPARLVAALLKEVAIDSNLACNELRRDERLRLATLFTALPVTIAALEGFASAMVTTGGVALNEVNRLTMESRLVPNLYFAGEILDIDGDCGGYNLQFAWSSGSLAGRSLAAKKVE
ncbi:MAG: NAD(P)/FAD-dependent oxidoreductase [Planctomycetia bacterium]|nr:NAD(P)/FAD-dependent oxidoreductase [Planctomycetia bacterium]